MKKYFLIFISILLFASTYAQSAAETALLDKMTEETCVEFNKIEVQKKDKASEIQMKMGLAIIPVLEKNKKEIKKIWGWDISNQSDLLLATKKLAGYAVYKCPKYMELTSELIKRDDKILEKSVEKMNALEKNSPPPSEPPHIDTIAYTKITGKIEKIEGTDLTYVYVKTTDGELLKLVWLSKFTGSENLENDSYKEKEIELLYETISIYQLKDKKYNSQKVISKIKIK